MGEGHSFAVALLLLYGFQGLDWILVLEVDTRISVMTDFGNASIQKTLTKVSAMHKFDIFREIYRLRREGDAWLDKIPVEISAAFFDNPYADSLCKTIDLLTREVFTEPEIEDMEWFLSESSLYQELTAFLNGKEVPINTIDEYINLLMKEGNWDLSS